MGMCGYDRVLIEPSGIFDTDEFFDVLNRAPLLLQKSCVLVKFAV